MSLISSISSVVPGGFGKPQDMARALKDIATDGVAGTAKTLSLKSTEMPAVTGGSSSFANVLERAVHEVNGKMNAAGVDQEKLMTGETNNLHQAMISVQEASVAFSLMVEVRNKLVESYQELMRMQV